MEELIKELEQDIIDCRLDAGDGGDNIDMISCALENLEKIRALAVVNFKAMDIQLMYKVKKNKDAKRWEFQPTGDWIGYTVAFHEADNKSDAWIAVYKAMKLQGRSLRLTTPNVSKRSDLLAFLDWHYEDDIADQKTKETIVDVYLDNLK
jgi:hypothetical protein